MLKAALFAALYGISNGYGDGGGQQAMCCTANVAMSNTYSVCEDVMNKYRDPADQEFYCLEGKETGRTKGVDTCKWTACSNVGYCVDARDHDYFLEMTEWEKEEAATRRSLSVQLNYDDVRADNHHGNTGWGNMAPRPTPRPTRSYVLRLRD